MTAEGTDVFPAVTRYLERLPAGIDSYPACQCKGSLVRATLAELPPLSAAAKEALPPAIAALIARPPDVSAWTPTVHHNALLAMLFSARYEMGDPGAFDRAAFEKSRRLFAGPLYRVLFAVLSVESLLRGADRRWGTFHRGTTLKFTTFEPGHASSVLEYKPDLFYDVPLRSAGQGLRAAIAATGAQDTALRYDSKSTTSTEFHITWRP